MSQEQWNNQSDPWSQPSKDDAWRTAPPPGQPTPTPNWEQQPAQPNPYLPSGTDPNYGQQAYGQQPYGVPYGGATYGGVADDPSSKRGLTSIILALSALVISLLFSAYCANAYGEVFRMAGTVDINSQDLPAEAQGAVMKAGMGVLGQLIPTGLGIAAFVVALTSMKFPSQKSKAVIGLITAIVAPIISFIVFAVMVAQHVPMG